MAGVKKVNKTTANTTNKSNGNGLKVFILIVLVLFFFVSLVMLWLYASNKPNYNDLNKAYNKLNIPSDWKLVSESSKKGTMGMFCFGGISDTSPCPMIIAEYKISDEIKLSENDEFIKQTLEDLIINYKNDSSKIKDFKCSNATSNDVDNKTLECSQSLIINNILVYISISDISAKGDPGIWLNIIISKNN